MGCWVHIHVQQVLRRPRPPPEAALKLASAALRGAGVVAAERFDWWGAAKKRENVMVYAELEQTATRAELCLATYHMPCWP